MNSLLKLLSAVLLCAVCCTVAVAEEYKNPTMQALKQGDAMLSIELPGLDGEEHDISRSASGGPVGVFFWSVFCANCKEAMPGLIRLYNEWKGKGLTIWAVNVDGTRFSAAVESFVNDKKFPLPVVYDVLEGEALRAADLLGVDKTPTLYLADSKGRVVHQQVADIEMDALKDTLEQLLD